jgi:hypothetical protein
MKTKHEQVLTSLLALGLIGAVSVQAQSGDSFNTFPFNNEGLVITNTINEDLNNDGNLDIFADTDIDGDGKFDLINETFIVEVDAGVDDQGNLIDIDYNNDGVIQQTPYAQDLDNDGFTDLGNEFDFDSDGVIDVGGEDSIGGDGRLTLGEDTDNDGNLDINENAIAGTDGDFVLDSGEVDIDGDGRFDTVDETFIVEVDAGVDGQGNLIDIDYNNDGVIQQTAYAADLDGDGFTDLGGEVDFDGDGRFDLVSEDLDGDTFFDQIDEDVDGDGTLDLFAEDVNRNGGLDTASRTYLTAVNPLTNDVQDLDIIVADALYVNGEQVLVQSNNLELGETGIEGVITRKANGEIHIGENSLITNEVGGVQELFARDGTGTAINIDITNGSDLLINGVSVATDDDVAAEAVLRIAGDAATLTSANTYTDEEVAAGNAATLTSANTYTDGEVAAEAGLRIAADTALGRRIDNNSSRIASNKEDIEQNTRGIAMVAALQHTTVLPGMTNAFDLSAAHFEGETGLALNYARRINENVQINFGAASTTDFDESVIKAGIGVQW